MGQELTLLPLQIQIGNQFLVDYNSQSDFILQENSLENWKTMKKY
jgi:hypothetical protein